MRKLIITMPVILMYTISLSQGLSHKGKEFWLGYGHNVLFNNFSSNTNYDLVLYLSAEKATQVTVSINATGWSQTVIIPAGKVDFSIVLPKSGANDCRIQQEGKFERGIHILATEPIVAYAHQYGVFSSAATLLLPVETLGYNYYSLNAPQRSNYPNSFSWMFVVATEDNTRINITPSDSTLGGILPGQTVMVELNKGEIYNLFGKSTGLYTGKDLTGTRVSSIEGNDGQCHPIAMFSGSSRVVLCNGDGGEVMQQQVFPASAWGTTFLTHYDIKNNSNNVNISMFSFYRVLVANPATRVKRNGIFLTNIQNNRYYDFSSNSGDFIEADQPILIAQFLPSSNQCTGNANPPVGDPEMLILTPLQQGIKSTTFYNTRKQNIDINYVDLIIHKNGLPSLRIDNNIPPSAAIRQHPAHPDYLFVARRLLGAASQHTITSDSPFVARVLGYGNFESYGYLAGTLVNNLNGMIAIENLHNNLGNENALTCTFSSFRMWVRLAYKASSILIAFSKTNGLSTSQDLLLQNPQPKDSVIIAGRKYFSYALPGEYYATNSGLINIPVIATSPEIDYCIQSEEILLNLEVKKGAEVSFSTTPGQICLGDSVLLSDQSQFTEGSITEWHWFYGDGKTEKKITGAPFFHTYPVEGNYRVGLYINTNTQCKSDTVFHTVTVLAPPLVDAGPDITVIKGQSTVLQAKAPVGQNLTFQWQPDYGLSNPHILRPMAKPDTSITYQLEASLNGLCTVNDTVRIIILSELFIPNSFSPNGDGLNDVWNIPGLAEKYPDCHLKVIDRYGQIIFSTKGFKQPWDGTKNGKQLPIGVYHYLLDLGDGSPKKSGSITLIK
jgi:trimeric autotransporter adhesin